MASKDSPRGFAAVPNWIVTDESISSHEKLVYLVLSSQIGGQGTWFMSHKQIGAMAGISIASVKRALDGLRKRGVLTWTQRIDPTSGAQMGNSYRLLSDRLGQGELPPSSERATPSLSVSDQNKNPEQEPEQENPPTPQGGSERDEEFEKIWAMWPRKVGKPAAQKAYASAVKRAKPEVIAAGVTAALQFFARERTEIRFVPHLSTWLNQNRWEDELTPTNQPVAPVEGSGPRLAPDEKLIDGIIWRRGRPRLGGQYGMTVAQYQEWQAEQQRLIQEARDRRG